MGREPGLRSYFAPAALLPDGWAGDVRIDVAAGGSIERVAAASTPEGAETLAGPLLPGMPNAHSHAFQRGMAGLAERAGVDGDSFWTWRETMYRFVSRLDPQQVGAIAAQVYVEMLKHGYTAVAEFHYLHHEPDGKPYADRAELSRRVVEAALGANIGITFLPVLYAYGGFGEQPATGAQGRFLNDPDGLMEIVTTLRRAYEDNPQVQIGVAPHSLRAVSPSMLEAIVRQVRAPDSRAPVHIHVAEQRREVEECLAWCGRRPVDWLLANAPVDESWCLVHATHMTGGEIQGLAASRAVVALCPTTEANLGDGVFPFALFHEAGGRFGIGSDSNVSVGVSEELRWLEYVQRLHGGRRLVAASRDCPSAGAALYRSALAGGRQAVARPVGRIEAGNRADWLVLDPSHAGLVGKSGDLLLDAFVFACTDNPVRDVMVGGKWVVREGAHEREEVMGAAFRDAIVELQK